MYKICRFSAHQILNSYNFFAICPIAEIFMGEIDKYLYFLTPTKKRVKKVPKGVFFNLIKKLPKILKMKKNFESQIYHTPFTLFTLFDKILKKQLICYSHLIF